MSNKTTLQSNNALISQNNTDLQALIDKANALPDAGSGGGSSSDGGAGTILGNKLNGAIIDLSHMGANQTEVFHTYDILQEIEVGRTMQNYVGNSMSTARSYYFNDNSSTIGKHLLFHLTDGTLAWKTDEGLQGQLLKDNIALAVSTDPSLSNPEIDNDYFTVIYHEYVCLLKNTLITLSNGQTKPIQEITYDDELLVWDFDNGCHSSAKPLWLTKTATASEYWHCEFENGLKLDMVGQYAHRVFSLEDNKFMYAIDCIGKDVVTIKGITKLISCELVKDTQEYYNLMTDYHINCYANDILTSTGLNNIYPIQNMKFIKMERPIIPIEKYNDIPAEFYTGLRLAEWTEDDIEWVTKNVRKKLSKMKPKNTIT